VGVDERERILKGPALDEPLSSIARSLSRSPSTVTQEVKAWRVHACDSWFKSLSKQFGRSEWRRRSVLIVGLPGGERREKWTFQTTVIGGLSQGANRHSWTRPPRRRLGDGLTGGHAFWRHDSAYLAWLQSHPAGFVVNCEHQPRARYLKLHRTTCGYLNLTGVKSWTDPYMKVCADDGELLGQWSLAEAGSRPDRYPACRP